jgi:hypothetical protein
VKDSRHRRRALSHRCLLRLGTITVSPPRLDLRGDTMT